MKTTINEAIRFSATTLICVLLAAYTPEAGAQSSNIAFIDVRGMKAPGKVYNGKGWLQKMLPTRGNSKSYISVKARTKKYEKFGGIAKSQYQPKRRKEILIYNNSIARQ